MLAIIKTFYGFTETFCTMAPLRWGIYSAGKISHDFVVGVKALPEADHQVVAVASRSEEDAAKFAKTHNIPRHYDSYSQLAKDAGVDVVYVGTIHPKHAEATRMMFEAGKPVLCEKPLTCSAAETQALIEEAKERGVFFMEAVWMRFFPAMAELRKQISEGVIGEVQYMSANFGFKGGRMIERLSNPKLGGGCVLDVGVYVINLATMVFGEKPEAVQSSGWLMPTGADAFAAITLKYPGERIAQLTCSIDVELQKEAVIVGTKGMIKVQEPFWCPTTLETPKGVLEFPLPSPCLPTKFRNSAGMCYEAEEVRQCITAGKKESAIMPLEHTQIVADIMDTVMRQIGRVDI